MSSTGGNPGKLARRRRQQVLVACARCRGLKTRCDGIRPACSPCLRANATCTYDTSGPGERRSQALRREHGDLHTRHRAVDDSLKWLRSQSPETALSTLQQLKDVEDPTAELCAVVARERGIRRPAELPLLDHIRAQSPFMKDSLTTELVIRHPSAFPFIPETEATINQKHEFGFTRNLPYDALKSFDPSSLLHRVHASRVKALKGGPPPRPGLADGRLSDLDISFWTTVPVSNELAASLISSYLKVEHPVYGFFDAELVLRDLLSHDVQYCTSSLVNALLFWTSCTFGPIYPEAKPLAERFLKEAQRLITGEKNSASTLTVASLMILAIGGICFGMDKTAQTYLASGVQVAQQLGLMGAQRCTAQQLTASLSMPLSMLEYVAWGAFNFSCVFLTHFHSTNTGAYTQYAPLLPIPCSDSALDTSQSLRDESSSPRLSFQSSSFLHFCRFWCIAHEIGSVLYSSAGPIHQHVPLAFAESKFRDLLQWAESLPPEAARSPQMPHNVAEMHICYQATIMDLFRPFLAKGQRLSTFSTSPRRPEAIFALALGHLRALVHEYHATYSGLPESHSISWFHGPLYVAPAILHYDRSQNWKSRFLFCIEACADLLQAHSALEGFVRALLYMAVDAGVFGLSEATACLDDLHTLQKESHHVALTEAGFVVDQNLAVEDHTTAIVDVLAQKFDKMLFVEDDSMEYASAGV